MVYISDYCQMGYLERKKWYCTALLAWSLQENIFSVFCTALLYLFKLKSWFLWNCTEVFQMHELQYFDLELIFNCLLSINEICWFWWSKQLKKRKNLNLNWYMNVVWLFMTKLKYLFHFFCSHLGWVIILNIFWFSLQEKVVGGRCHRKKGFWLDFIFQIEIATLKMCPCPSWSVRC